MASIMLGEARSAPTVVETLLRETGPSVARLCASLRREPPAVVVTIARGSSDHAATYGKYLIEALCGVPVASAPPSISSLYHGTPRAGQALVLAVSQSGRSPDLLATVDGYRAAGARVVAIVNAEDSPLAERAHLVLPMHAGEERAVAATKTCIASMVALAALAAEWSEDAALGEALRTLPGHLEQALAADWSAPLASLADIGAMLVLGRGFGLGIAQEAALKLKEICAIQAEPFSSAEVRHGPQRIIGPQSCLLGFAQGDEAGRDVLAAMGEFADRGAVCWTAGPGGGLTVPSLHPTLQPIAMLASFYIMAERLAAMRGMDPDAPPHLSKITETV